MNTDGWCAQHRGRLHEAKDARLAAEALLVRRVLEGGLGPGTNGCWACALSEKDFQDALREGGTLIAKAEAYGGTYTSQDVAIMTLQNDTEGCPDPAAGCAVYCTQCATQEPLSHLGELTKKGKAP